MAGDNNNDREEKSLYETENGKPLSEEEVFAGCEVVQPWQKQITIRSLVVSVILGVIFSFIVMRLNVSTGIIPSLNVAAGLLGFALIKGWVWIATKVGYECQPFTRQENTVIQTCVVATSGIAFSSGFASYILGMTANVAAQADSGNTAINTKTLELSWMIPFTLLVSFVGLFSIVPLRKIMVVDYKLTYPSGTATARLINSFHTPAGAKLAMEQVKKLFWSFGGSFLWAGFQWFFTAGDDCGFASFPTFGLKAYAEKISMDFSTTYIGVGMLCPYYININMVIGAVISWVIMWPLIEKQRGNWFSADLPLSSLRSLQGYKIFIAIAMILGDGLFYFVLVFAKAFINWNKHRQDERNNKDSKASFIPDDQRSYDDVRRTQYFLKDQVPWTLALGGYVVLAILSVILVPFIFNQIKWYHILVIYVIAPVMAFCNSYGCGLTDWSLASSYGKLGIIFIGMWVGSNGGVVAGLAACGVMMSIVSTASDLMQDFKTGYLTLASPRSMFVSQIFGTLIGCFTAPLVFWFFFYKAYPDLGKPGSTYPAPYGLIYRGIALIGVEGFSALPKYCFLMSILFFVGALILNAIREVLKHKTSKFPLIGVVEWHLFVPSPMAMAIPFFLGGYFAFDMILGSAIKLSWELSNREKADAFVPAVASGLVCGESLWGIPAAIMSLFNIQPPICMKFLSRSANAKVDAFLSSS
ncbi:putative metal-nicotianamine transporter ysl7 [Ranunculus cassubicifolius]